MALSEQGKSEPKRTITLLCRAFSLKLYLAQLSIEAARVQAKGEASENFFHDLVNHFIAIAICNSHYTHQQLLVIEDTVLLDPRPFPTRLEIMALQRHRFPPATA